LKIGIFGKSGSGKTTLANFFEEIGFFHVDLDKVGRTVVDKYPGIIKKISETFGAEYIKRDGLDRNKLANLVFSDEKELAKLNSIFFEYIKTETVELLIEHKDCVVEGAVLAEIGLDEFLDHVIYVQTTNEIALDRLIKRENLSQVEIQKRLDSQAKYDVMSKIADHIIYTDDDPVTLNKSINELFLKLNLQNRNPI